MTRAKAALNMIMMSFISAGIVGVVWVLWGYSMTTGDGFLGLFGNPPFAHFGLQDLIGSPDLIKAGFAATFAIITVASSAVRSPTAPSSALGHCSFQSGSPWFTARWPT